MTVTKDDILNAIVKAGLDGNIVCLHSSLKSFGYVEGGADAVVEAFLDAGCTLVTPSFTYDYKIAPLMEIKQNAQEDEYIPKPSGRIYTPDINEIASDMGAIPRAVVNTSGRFRGVHPTNSFVALGPCAKEIIETQTPEDVYAPLQVIMDKKGYIVMAGIDLTKMTVIHYAEQLAGRELFIRWALGPDGAPVRMREGSCSDGFNCLQPFVSDIEKQITVGNSLWRIYPVCEVVDACVKAIKQDAGITHCDNLKCTRCNDMQKGGPINP